MRLLGWGGRSGREESRWGGGKSGGGPLLVHLLEVIDSVSFHPVRCTRGNWQGPLGTVANDIVLDIEEEI